MMAAAAPAMLPGAGEPASPDRPSIESGQVTIHARGYLGQEMQLETSGTLTDPWENLDSQNADSTGRVSFTEPVDSVNRFYRVLGVPMELPLVYPLEETRPDCPAPPLPAFEELPEIIPLTDPFLWSDGSGRIQNFGEWGCRRAEIKAEFEEYEIGPKPPRPENITATYAGGVLTVNITENGETLTLTSAILLPQGEGPFPAIIGMGSDTGSLPSDIFSSRGIVRIPFNFGQVMAHTQVRGEEPINRLYPDLTYMGAYCAWSWGVSRLIDGLELVQEQLPVDLERIGVTGCSFAGKMALWAGAFDERIALTIAQEPGGGGAAAWRVSELLPGVETLGATNHAWFMESMFRFSGSSVSRLPMDHHELMAMVMPRALLVLGNPDYTWLAEESGYVSSRAAREVWKAFGIGDRMGFSIVAGHSHCSLPESQRPEVEAFVDKFLMGIQDVDTNVVIHPFEEVNYGRWTAWWGTDDPVFPKDDSLILTLEPECGTVGESWAIREDAAVSNGKYVQVKPGYSSRTKSPPTPEGHVSLEFSVDKAGEYDLYWLTQGSSSEPSSFWVELDDELPRAMGTSSTNGWEWQKISTLQLEAGVHTLSIGYRFEGSKLDKIMITDYPYPPDPGLGPEADNLCP